jgi:uncharacterized cupin superfamily protein
MRLPEGTLFDARQRELDYAPVPADQRVAGDPMIGVLPLGTVGTVDIGVWEMTEGAMSDVEVDEVFVVISGRADVVIAAREPGGEDIVLHLGPGSMGRLSEGMRSIWTVHEPLRKVYVLGSPPRGTFLPSRAVANADSA